MRMFDKGFLTAIAAVVVATISVFVALDIRRSDHIVHADAPIVHDRSPMRRFELHRTHDPSGKQRRTDIVAEGLEFGDGHIAMR